MINKDEWGNTQYYKFNSANWSVSTNHSGKMSILMTVNLPSEPSETSQQDTPDLPEPGFGWTQYAEKINGRFAMVGFVALLVTELVTNQDFITWLGLR